MAYSVKWLRESEEELKRFFSKHFQDSILTKVDHIAANLPTSLSLRGVQPIRDQEELELTGRLFELDVGSGPQVAFVLYDDIQLLLVYLVGTHDYAKSNYIRAALERLAQ